MDQGAINKMFKDIYGVSPHGKPWFRLVFSETQTEKRSGIHTKWYGPIWLGESFGTELCKKYMYLKDQWVIEKWYYHDPRIILEVHTELGVKATYEPIWAFPNRDGQPILPSWDACVLVVNCLLHGRPMTKAEYDEEERKQFAKEVAEDKMAMEEANPVFGTLKREGELIIRP